MNFDARDEAIVAAAMTLFRQGGLAAVTIRGLCGLTGASTGSIYHRFGDRNGVLIAVYQECWRPMAARMRHAVLAKTSAEGGVRALVGAWLDGVAAEPDAARFVYAASESGVLSANAGEMLAEKQALVIDILLWAEPHILAGRLRRLPGWAWDPVLLGPAHEIARRWLAGGEFPWDEACEVAVEAVWRAIQGPNPC